MFDPKIDKYAISSKERPNAIAFADFNFFSQSLLNEQFNKAIEVFDIIYCDGYWLYRMLKCLGYDVHYYPGPKFFNEFITNDYKITILSKYIESDFTHLLAKKNINIIQLPFVENIEDFNFLEISALIGNDLDIFVSLGCPKQELFIERIKQFLPESSTCYAIGAAIDFSLGKEKRAPKVIQKLRLEFMWRLILSSRKQWKKWIKVPKVLVWFIKKLIMKTLRKYQRF